MKKLLFSLFVVAFAATNLFASNTEVDDIWYDFDHTKLTAFVTYKGNSYNQYNNEYTGSVVIPTSVSYNGKTYSVTKIGEDAFTGCSGLTSVTIGNSVTTIEEYAFSGCSGLTSVAIPNSVTTIGEFAFYNCSGLTSVTIPNSVTTIGDYAFWCCSSLTSIEIPNSVTTIGIYTFAWCSSLTSITNYATTPPTCDYDCFYNVSNSIPVYVPAHSVDAYKQAKGWKEFFNILPIEQTGLYDCKLPKISNKFIYDNQLYFRHNNKLYHASGDRMR